MGLSLSTSLLGGGFGFFGRFFIAFAILVLLKATTGNDKELDRGLKLLIILGVVVLLLVIVLAIVWFSFFGSFFTFSPFSYSYKYYLP